jgi:hypothetical protein
VIGIVTGALARHQLLQLANGLAACHLDPRALVFGGRDASELAHGRPVQRALLESLRHRRQLLQRLGHAQAFLRRARFVAEHAFDILTKAAKAEMHVRRRTQRREQPTALFGIRRGPLFRQARQRFMCHHPFALIDERAVHFPHELAIPWRFSCSAAPRRAAFRAAISCEAHSLAKVP